MRIAGEHLIYAIGIAVACASAVYAQQPAAPTACSGGLADEVCDPGWLDHAASNTFHDNYNQGFPYRFSTGALYAGSYSEQDDLGPDGLWRSPFASRQGDSLDEDGSDVERTLRTLTLGGRWAQAQNQQAPPTPSATLPSAQQGSPKHIFGIVPAFEVSYLKHFKPLTPREKFDEWARGTYDPGGLGLYAAEAATLEHSSSDGFCGYGESWGGYGKCFGSMELDANISGFFGDFLFPVIMHQDPRFFRLGKGPVAKRVLYAVSRVFITHADSGRDVFFVSALSGSVLAAAASNLYYPRQDRGFSHSLNRFGIDLADTAAFNVSAEYWPEIKHELKRIF